tara:strand:- start:25 stop:381 length:357 start_codon:yes stop_codon:yes gene_type:complete
MSYKFYYGNINLNKLILPRNNWDGAKYILAVLNSIKKEGLKKPFIIKETYYNDFEILLGGARYWALKKLKIKEAPCIIISSKKVKNCKRIKSYEELLKIAKVEKLWYLGDRLYCEGST